MSSNTAPGPKGHWLTGSFKDFNKHRLVFQREMVKYGGVTGAKFGPYPVLFANSPEALHQVLVTDASKYYKSNVTKTVLRPALGNGLFINDGDSWKRQRRLTQPAFHHKRISAYADVMVDYAGQLGDQLDAGEAVDMNHAMTDLTMRIIAKTMFDADVNADAREIGDTVTELLAVVGDRFSRLYNIPLWLPIPSNRNLKKSIARLDELIQGFIDERRTSGVDKGDLLSMLLMAQDEEGTGSMTDQQVRDEALTIFGAGHETTAVALGWAWYVLSEHPEIEARLHEELDRVLNGRLPTLQDLPELPYLEMVVKETMRMYPPAFITTRDAHEDCELGGFPVKKGQTVVVNIYGSHMNPEIFPNPDVFDPERFSPENEKLIPKYGYLPFGGGPRVCIGNAFSMMEARLIVATLAQRFQFRILPGQDIEPLTYFTLRPSSMQMRVEARVSQPKEMQEAVLA